MSEVDTDAVRERVVEALERSAEMYGLNRSSGRVYGVLYFADGSLTIPELVERTGYAKSTISTVTRQLDRIGLARRRSGSGRRVEFEARTDVWFILQDVYRQFAQREMAATVRALRRAEQDLSASVEADDGRPDGSRAEHDLERVRELQENYEKLRLLFDLAADRSIDELVELLDEGDAEQTGDD